MMVQKMDPSLMRSGWYYCVILYQPGYKWVVQWVREFVF